MHIAETETPKWCVLNLTDSGLYVKKIRKSFCDIYYVRKIPFFKNKKHLTRGALFRMVRNYFLVSIV